MRFSSASSLDGCKVEFLFVLVRVEGSVNSSALAWTKLYTVDTVNAVNGRFVMPTKDLKALMRRVIDAFNQGEAAVMTIADELVDANFVYHRGMGNDIHGLKDYKQSMKEFFSAFPDAHWTIDDIVVEGDKAAVRYTITGTHKGELMGIPATNKKVTVWVIGIDRMAGGKVVEAWDRMDTLGLMLQLGVVPTPGKGK
jgi:predicted ester cyclase